MTRILNRFDKAMRVVVPSFCLVVIGLLVFSQRGVKERSVSRDCANQLRSIGLGLHMYSGDCREAFASSLSLLAPYVKQPELFICPSAERTDELLALTFKTVDTHGSYYYLPCLSEANDSDMVHMFDHPDNHGGEGGNILYVGGYVQWVPIEPDEDGVGFWEVLEASGVTREMVESVTNRLIDVHHNEHPTEEGAS